MKNMIFCDTHSDTASVCLDNGLSLFKNTIHSDFKRMKKYRHFTSFLASFSLSESTKNPHTRCMDILKFIISECETHNDTVYLCKSFTDIKKSYDEDKISVFLSIEGGEAINHLSQLKEFYDLGVRMITLTWNYDNLIGGGVLGDGKGLSQFGKEIVSKSQELGIVVDLSHASENSFYDALEISKKPVILSHSNSYSVCKNARNITDRQFLDLIKNGGICGINFCPQFLSDKGDAKISDIILHIEHFLSLGGENNICIGSDFDGINSLPCGILGVQDLYKIFDILSRLGVNDEIIQKIAYKNIYRLLSICL